MPDRPDGNPDLNRRELLGNNSYSRIRPSVETSRKRRGFLQNVLGIFGISTATFGFSEQTSALTPAEEELGVSAVQEYADKMKRKEAIQTHAEDTLEMLEEKGHISQSSVSQLPVHQLHRTVKSYGEASEGTLVVATVNDGKPSIKIQVKKKLADRELVLIVEPEVGRSRAVLRDFDDTASEQVIAADEDISTQSDCICDSTNECIDDLCGFHCCCNCAKVKVKKSCSDSDSEGCEVIDESCCGSYTCEIWAS